MAKGLPDVTQKVGMDADKYFTEGDKVIDKNVELGDSSDDLAEKFERNQMMVDAFAIRLGQLKEKLESNKQAVRDYSGQLGELQNKLISAQAAQERFNSTEATLDRLSAAYENFNDKQEKAFAHMAAKFEAARVSIGAMAADAMVQSERIVAGFERGSAQVRMFTSDVGGLRSSVSDTAAAVDDMSRSIDVLRAKAAGAGPSTISVLGPVLAAAAAEGGGGGSPWSGTTDAATAAIIARNIARSGGTTSNTGNPAVEAALGALLGGGGGGGGGGGAGGFLGAFGDALRPSSIFGGAMGTVKMAHMIAMFTMETLSTVIPAGVAMAAAGFTGLQGGVNAYTTGTSLYNATEALGGAYGKTFGSYLGLGSSFQAAQNMANGGVYGITGGVLNLAGQGRDAFSNMGVQTVAMIDRGIASMVLGNRMQAVGAALAGGTQDLRSFGDVGANIGNTLLNLAPALPGLGPDLLGGLKGITGAASFITGHVPTPLLGAGLAAEAGYRWGDLALAGGKMPWFLGGKQVGGLSGLASRMGMGELPMSAADAEAAGLLPEGAAAAGAEGIAGTGLAGLLAGGAAGLPIGALTAIAALSAYGISKGSFGTVAARQMGGYLGPINQSFGANAWQPISKALYQAAGVQANLPGEKTETVAGQQVTVGQPIGELMREGYSHSQAVAKYASEFASNTQQLAGMQANLIAAGPQAVKALQDMGYKGESVSQALTMMTDAMVSPSMIGAGGKISATGLQMMKQFMTTYSPMTGTGPGAILAGASAQDIMSYSGMKSLQTLNSAMDSVSQIIMGGATGAAASYGAGQGLAGAVTPKKGQSVGAAIAQALGASPFSAQGASAWSAFTTGTANAPGAISTLQSEGDQLRTYLTLGALSSGQAGSLGAYEARQFLPDVQGSPMAMAMLAQQAVASGVPGANYYNSKLSPAQNYAALQKALTQHGISGQHAANLLTQGTIKTADLPALAASLITSQSGASPLDTAEVTQAGTQALAIQQAVAAGKPLGGNLSGLVATLMAGQGAKYQPGAISAGLTSILGQEGIGGSKLSGLVQQGKVIYKAEYDKTNPPTATGTAKFTPIFEKFTPPKLGDQTYNVTGHAVVPHIPKTPDQTFNINGHMHAPAEPHYADQSFTVTGHLVMVGGGAGVPATGSMVGSGGHLLLGQHGFRVPGMGSGDIVHAMLEPGELVVPRHMVTSGMVDHLKGKIPGFQGGGVIDVPTYAGGAGIRSALEDVATQLMSFMAQGFAGLSGSLRSGGGYGLPYSSALTGGPPPNSSSPPVPVHIASVAPPAVAALGGSGQFPGAAGPMPKAAMKVIDAFEESFKNMPGPWNKLASQILTGLLDGVKNSTHETAAMATTLVNKVKTEIAYGQGVANTAVAGLNFGGMQVASPTMTAQGKPYQYYIDQQNIAAGGQPGSVQEQMGSYLQAMQSFQGDMGKLAKGGLQKRLLSQLYAAGPVQGDAEAQSILGGAGGIKAANQLYNQINSLATKLGVQAMGEQYGTPGKLTGKTVHAGATVSGTGAVHALQSAIDALHGKTVTVTVNIASGGGTASGTPKLNKTQLKQVTQQVRTEILQQAKRNRSSALTLSGYGS